MAYPYTLQLKFPLDNYNVNSLGFGLRGIYDGEDWGIHLGEDVLCRVGTAVHSIGRGRVIYSALYVGNESRGNWGNIIIVAHKNPHSKKVFYALYGHLGKRYKQKGDRVEMGEKIGVVGKSYTKQNGWWVAHLHFAIYTGCWVGKILPGYYKKEQKNTRPEYWKNPSKFINKYKNYYVK